jgi:hypothetical protein
LSSIDCFVLEGLEQNTLITWSIQLYFEDGCVMTFSGVLMTNLLLTVISGTSSTRVSRDVLDLMEAIIEVERRLLIAGLALSVQVAGRSLLYTATLLA